MSTNLPAAPPAPDYAKANKEGIETDIATLPLRRKIEAASAAGTKITYTDFNGKEQTADFTGLGEGERAAAAAKIMSDQSAQIQKDQLALRKELGVANVKQTDDELRAADPAAYAARKALGAKLTDEAFGKADYAKYVVDNKDLAEAYMRETGGSLTAGDAEGKIAAWGKKHYDIYGGTEGRELTRTGAPGDEVGLDTSAAGMAGRVRQRAALGEVGSVETDTSAGRLNDRVRARQAALGDVQTDTSAARLNDRVRDLGGAVPDDQDRMAALYRETQGLQTEASDASSADLNEGLQSAMAEFRKGGKLDDDTKRELLNETRAGQAARGNYLGDAAAVAEATELGGAMERRKEQRLNNLLDVQGKVFEQNDRLRGQNRSAAQDRLGRLAALTGQDNSQKNTTWGNRRNALGMENDINVQQLGENRATRGENDARWASFLATENDINKQQVDENRATRGENAAIRSENEGNWNRNMDRENLLNKQQVDENRATRNENYARSQQRLANASSMILGNQVTNQWGSLAAAANGAVGAPTGVGYTPGIGQNANAGAQGNAAAQSNFGTLSNMWNTAANIAQQDNAGKLGAISGVAGMALGGFGGKK